MPNTGRTALVTGGTDGVGKEIARGLARAGCRVILVGRDIAKGTRAERELRDATGNAEIAFIRADLSLMREANRLADEVVDRWPAVHCLVHSAGIVRGRHEMTSEGVESNFAVNYLSRFVLTNRLLARLEAGGTTDRAARIVIIGGAAQNGTIDFDDVNLTARFTTIRAVLQFCQANDLFTIELARRLAVTGARPAVTITSLKLGVVKTNIRRAFPWWMKLVVPLIADPLLGQTPRAAAEAALRLALAPEFEGVTGALFLKIAKFKEITPSARTLDRATASRLWALSEWIATERSTAHQRMPAGKTKTAGAA